MDDGYTRRTALGALGAGLAVATAGCSVFGGDDPNEAILDEVYIANYNERPHVVDVVVQDLQGDHRPVFVESVQVEAYDPSPRTPVGRSLQQGLPESSGSYTCWVRMDEGDWEEVSFEDSVFFDQESPPSRLYLIVEIGAPDVTEEPPTMSASLTDG